MAILAAIPVQFKPALGTLQLSVVHDETFSYLGIISRLLVGIAPYMGIYLGHIGEFGDCVLGTQLHILKHDPDPLR